MYRPYNDSYKNLSESKTKNLSGMTKLGNFFTQYFASQLQFTPQRLYSVKHTQLAAIDLTRPLLALFACSITFFQNTFNKTKRYQIFLKEDSMYAMC